MTVTHRTSWVTIIAKAQTRLRTWYPGNALGIQESYLLSRKSNWQMHKLPTKHVIIVCTGFNMVTGSWHWRRLGCRCASKKKDSALVPRGRHTSPGMLIASFLCQLSWTFEEYFDLMHAPVHPLDESRISFFSEDKDLAHVQETKLETRICIYNTDLRGFGFLVFSL